MLLSNKIKFFIILAAMFFTIVFNVKAAGPYNPSQTLDPNCLPTDVNCYVITSSTQATTINNFLTVNGTTTLASTTINGQLVFSSASGTSLTLTGNELIGGSLTVLGTSTLATTTISDLTANHITATGQGLTLTSSIPALTANTLYNQAGVLMWNGQAINTASSSNFTNITITGTSTFATTTINGSTTINNNFTVTGSTTLNTLTAGSTTLSTTTINGLTTINNNFTVVGTTTLASTTINGKFIFNNASGTSLSLTGNELIGGSLTVLGTSTLATTTISDLTANHITATGQGLTITSAIPAVTANTLYNNAGTLYWNGAPIGGALSGGQATYLAVWTSSSTLSTSTIFYATSTGFIGIGTTTPTNRLSINGGITIASTTPAATSYTLYNLGGTLYWNGSAVGSGGGAVVDPNQPAIGTGAMGMLTSGIENAAYGAGDLANLTSGSYNTAVGDYAMNLTTTGFQNTAIGDRALHDNSTGYNNVAVGYIALSGNTTGHNNNALGVGALSGNTTGSFNDAIGYTALGSNGAGQYNIAIGFNAANQNKDQVANVYIGGFSGFNNISGSRNVFIGYHSGYNELGSNRLYIDNGFGATPLIYGAFDSQIVNINNQLGINLGLVAPSYALQVNGQPAANGYTSFTNYSDLRLKENILDVPTSTIDKLLKLRPVSFNYNDLYYKTSGYTKPSSTPTYQGFIAQELKEVFPEMVSTNQTTGYLDTNLSGLTIYLVKGLQTQEEQISNLKYQISKLEEQISNFQFPNSNSQGSVTLSLLDQLAQNGALDIKSDVNFYGHIYASGDSVGSVKILSGQGKAKIIFNKNYNSVPIVLLSLAENNFSNWQDIHYQAINVSPEGFNIEVKMSDGSIPNFDVQINWQAIGLLQINTDNTKQINTDTLSQSQINTDTAGQINTDSAPLPTGEPALLPTPTPTPTTNVEEGLKPSPTGSGVQENQPRPSPTIESSVTPSPTPSPDGGSTPLI